MLENILVPKELPIAATFGLPPETFEPGATTWGYEIPAPESFTDPEMAAHAQYLRSLIPAVDPLYQHRDDVVPDLVYYWNHRFDNPEVLCLTGPSGSGKTSAWLQFMGKLGVPCFTLKGGGKITLGEIFGQMSLVGGETVFEPAPMTLAPQYGLPVLFNEFDRNPSDINVTLNDVAENRPFPVPGNHSKVVEPLPGFCIIVTTNTNMVEQNTKFGTAKAQDRSILERLSCIQVGYSTDRKVERGILAGVLQPYQETDLAYWFEQEGLRVNTTGSIMKEGDAVSRADFIETALDLVQKVRELSLDPDAEDALEVDFSTRHLRRWVHHAVQHMRLPERTGKSALHYCLDKYVANLATATTRVKLHQALEAVFGVGPDVKD
ncbi:MAG: AAA family ATPase [Candidatus Nanopelagicales bacterium]